jgi:hypothetical protein
MQTHSNTAQGQGTAPPTPSPASARRILPGDRVRIFDALVSQNVWIIVDEVLITNGRTKLRSGNMTFYFDESLVIRHTQGGQA